MSGNILTGRSQERLDQKHHQSRCQNFLQLLDKAFAPPYPWKKNLDEALNEVEGAATGLLKHFIELPQSWKVILPTAIVQSFVEQVSTPGCVAGFSMTCEESSFAQGDRRAQDVARVLPHRAVQVTLPCGLALKTTFQLGGTRSCAFFKEQLSKHSAHSLADFTASSEELLLVVKGQCVRASFFASPSSDSVLAETISGALAWQSVRNKVVGNKVNWRAASSAAKDCLLQGVWGLACLLVEGVWGLICLLVGALVFGCLGSGLCFLNTTQI